MFRPNLNLFDDKNFRIECEKVFKKQKNQIRQKQIVYQLKQSSHTSHNLNACPLILKPTKLSDSALHVNQNGNVERKTKRQKHKRSKSEYQETNCTNTAMHESILTGLQTVIDLCGLLDKCEEKRKKKQREYKNKEHGTINKELNYTCHTNDFHANSNESLLYDRSANIPILSAVPNTPNVCTLLSHENHCTINKDCSGSTITLLPSEQNIRCNRSLYEKSLQILTLTTRNSTQSKDKLNELQGIHVAGNQSVYNVQESKDVNQPSLKQEPSALIHNHIGSTGHIHSENRKSQEQMSQNDNIQQCLNATIENCHLENSTNARKTDSLRSLINERQANTSSTTIVKSKSNRRGSKTSANYEHPKNVQGSKRLSTKYFPPMEIVPEPKGQSSEHVSVYDPSTLCNPNIPNPIYKTQIDCRKSRHGIPLVQPVIGCCKSGKCGDSQELKNTKYALVKICEFIGFNVYEIMKPYKNKPKNIPTCIAEIFVTLQKEDNYFISQKSTKISFQIPDKTRKSITKLHSIPYSPALLRDTSIKDQPVGKTKSKCCAKSKTNRSVSVQRKLKSV